MGNYRYVNTRLGTFNLRRFSNGNVLPYTAVPHGMATFTVQTEQGDDNWFYSPYSHSFEGIRLTHRPSPWMGDYGQLILTGQRGPLLFDAARRWSVYDRRGCVLEPAYMRGYVYRDEYTFELSPVNSGAKLRFTFSEEGENRVNLIGWERTVFTVEKDCVTGYTTAATHPASCGELREYFVLKLSVPFSAEEGRNAISLLTRERVIDCSFATSFLSVEQAKRNCEREIGSRTLEEVKAAGEEEWERYLSKATVEGDEDRKGVFYTCMFHAYLWPRRFYEWDEEGRPVHLNFKTGERAEGVLYTDNGFWDTYRTLFPYLSLVDTALYAEMAEGFLNFYHESGWLPKWLSPDNVSCMPGMLIEAVLADAIVKDLVPRDTAEKLLEAMLKDGEVACDEAGLGRVCLGEYRKYGYIPYTAAKESVNETLDCCYGDYCIAQAARKLGKTEIAERYEKYAKNYALLFDKETGFMRGRDEKGNFRSEPFESCRWGGDYTEGSAWQNSFAVYHDIAGLDALYGGKLAEKIDRLLEMPPRYFVGSYGEEIHEMSEMAAEGSQCAISNQPSFHIPYIYSELGDVKRTAELVEKLSRLFTNDEEGFPGDEDNGSMASWFLLSALGLYPMCPSRPDFTVSVPLFDKISLTLANGNVLVAERAEYDADKMNCRVSYADVMKGGDLAKRIGRK